MMRNTGFTLIEILLTVSIFGVIINLSSGLNLSSLERNSLFSEQILIVSILERARSLAMANLDNQDYGFCYLTPNYIIFKGDDCNQEQNDEIPANTHISDHPGTTFPSQIIFKKLTGDSTDATIHLRDSTKTVDININHAGRIDW
ncbi:MAG: prepilin-type N-terminal cleavage/methylation domain-containing protein [Candidatus Pacebacteria bacterium]|nr:prepilin-type N-terminal cleavage/methylation domain-containing protein [Candidatus Paceibacterota bacterium]